MSEKAVMPVHTPRDGWSGNAEAYACEDYDTLRTYATALREENERLKQIIGAFALQAQTLGIKELTLSIDAAKGEKENG